MKTKTYVTKQKSLILTCLKENCKVHLTADQIAEQLKQTGAPVGLTTVYRQLERLEKEGLVVKYTFPSGQKACYQYEGEEAVVSHYHLVCTECGQVIHLECDHLNALSSHIAQAHQFQLDNYKTVLYGTCASCSEV